MSDEPSPAVDERTVRHALDLLNTWIDDELEAGSEKWREANEELRHAHKALDRLAARATTAT